MEFILIVMAGILLGALLPVPKSPPLTDDLLAEIMRRVLRRL
jgi:hypothetical protein